VHYFVIIISGLQETVWEYSPTDRGGKAVLVGCRETMDGQLERFCWESETPVLVWTMNKCVWYSLVVIKMKTFTSLTC